MKNFIYILISFILGSQLFAQGGSIYSRFGIGNIYYDNSARKLSLGGTAVSIYDMRSVNNYNPASWFNLQEIRFETGLNFNGFKLSDEKSDASYSSTKFQGVVGAIPIDRDLGIVISGGLVPYSNVNYEVRDEFTDNVLNETYISSFKGDGGLSKFYIGLSYLTPLNISIGASYEYYVGKINSYSDIDFIDNTTYEDVEYRTSNYYRGKGLSVGLLSMNLARLFDLSEINELRLGANFNYVGELETDSSNFSTTTLGEIKTTIGEYKTKLPFRLGLGISCRIWDNYLFLIDYMHQPWSKFEKYGKNVSYYKDLNRYSLGIEYQNLIKRVPSFWEQIAIRGGIVFEETQYRINNQDLSMLAFQLGFSFPLGTFNTMDIGFQYGVRGTTESNLVKENIFQATITLSFGELWFIRPDR
ncbi:MAG: hypothetical protein JXA68_01945 [Ignavibacteriales bacterium]|nr:hypothetical protein [Ignavibacteriales bacterium]